MQKKRFWKQDTKKLDCMATIQMKEVLKFPDHKVLYYCIVQKHILVWSLNNANTIYSTSLLRRPFPIRRSFPHGAKFSIVFSISFTLLNKRQRKISPMTKKSFRNF